MSNTFTSKPGYTLLTYPEVTAMLVTPESWESTELESFIDAHVVNPVPIQFAVQKARETGSAKELASMHVIINISGGVTSHGGKMMGLQFGTVIIKNADGWQAILYDKFKQMYDGDFAKIDEEYAQYVEWATYEGDPIDEGTNVSTD